jgi:hypothetical protein
MIYDLEVRADRLEMESNLINELNSIKTFEFHYYGWIPSYGDFDDDFEVIHANSKEEAERIFYSRKRFIKYGPSITEIE